MMPLQLSQQIEEAPEEEEDYKHFPALEMLYIPKLLIEESEHKFNFKRTRSEFNSFKKTDSIVKFEKDSEESYPRDTIKGLSSRLEYNEKTRINYLSFYDGQRTKALNNVVGDIKNWKKRAEKMPKVRVIRRAGDAVVLPQLSNTLIKGMESLFLPKKPIKYNTVHRKHSVSDGKIKQTGTRTKSIPSHLCTDQNNIDPRQRSLLTAEQRNQTTEFNTELTENVVSFKERMKYVKELKGYWIELASNQQLDAREGATMNIVNGQIILLGGVNQRMLGEINSFAP